MKVNVTMSIDEDLIREARDKKINISGSVNDALREILKPKKADFKKEDLTLEIVKFGEGLKLTPDMAVFTHENLHLDSTAIWKTFKDNYEPEFNLFDYMEIRKKFKEKFFKEII